MTVSDVNLLTRKILVGIIVTLIPFLILFGGIWLLRDVLSRDRATENTTIQPSK